VRPGRRAPEWSICVAPGVAAGLGAVKIVGGLPQQCAGFVDPRPEREDVIARIRALAVNAVIRSRSAAGHRRRPPVAGEMG
jgi:hypothetical protein